MPKNIGSPVPKRAVSACSSSAGASNINIQQSTDEVFPDNELKSPHIKLIVSHKIKIQNSALNSSQDISIQKEKSKLKFSIHSILNSNRDSSGNRDSNKSQKMNPTPILTPEAKLESLIDLNTGQMSRSAFHTPVRPHCKDVNGLLFYKKKRTLTAPTIMVAYY